MELSREQWDRLTNAWERVQMARRELDALIGDNYLAPRVNIVGVHFIPLAAAVDKLRWAETEWRELGAELLEGAAN
ncbi:MAG: hypothetical protein ABIS18_11100 [Actinomycetota bacterium]